MPNNDRARTYTEAVLAQLNAEIAAHDTTVKDLAGELGMDYNTFRRYTKGERDMPMPVLWDAIAALGIDELTFITRAKERSAQR